MKDTRFSYLHEFCWYCINESGLKYILVTKIYDECESYDVSHTAVFSEQRLSSPWMCVLFSNKMANLNEHWLRNLIY